MFLPRQSERRLEHKAVDVVMPLKICPLVLLLFLIEEGHHVRHLDVGKLWVQVFRIHLCYTDYKQAKYQPAFSFDVLKNNFSSWPRSVRYLVGVLDHLDVISSKLVRVELEQPLGDF